jgi:hypothetical protein
LVANTNPRFRQTAQGYGSALLYACWFSATTLHSPALLHWLARPLRSIFYAWPRSVGFSVNQHFAETHFAYAPVAAPLRSSRMTPTQTRLGGNRIL